MAKYLLDTSAVIDWLGGRIAAKDRIETLMEQGHSLALSCVTITELYSGLSREERPRVDRVTSLLEYWDIDRETAKLAGHYRYEYARQGIQISTPDALQAALAVRNDAALITKNVRDFPMPDLNLEPLP